MNLYDLVHATKNSASKNQTYLIDFDRGGVTLSPLLTKTLPARRTGRAARPSPFNPKIHCLNGKGLTKMWGQGHYYYYYLFIYLSIYLSGIRIADSGPCLGKPLL